MEMKNFYFVAVFENFMSKQSNDEMWKQYYTNTQL